MSTVLQLFLEIAILVFAAKTAGLASSRLGQPAVLGEILAGLILGPSLLNLPAWPWFTDQHLPETIAHLAEIGVAFLMFIAGLEADLQQMRRAGKVVLLAGVLGVVVPLALGLLTSLPFGFDLVPAFAVGLLLTATSVSISAQTLLELGRLRTKEGIALLGAAVVDDVLVILLLSVFVGVVTGVGAGAVGILVLLARVALFTAVFGVGGWFVLPWLLAKVNKLPISEGVLATVVVLILVYGWSAEVIGGVALITGAFMAGILAARSSLHRRIFEGISALTYGLFVPIFFVNIGLGANIWALEGRLVLLAVAICLVAVVSKVVGCGAGALLGGFSPAESLRLGVGMISRGEVGLIVASLLVRQGLIGPEIVTIAVVMVLVTTLVTPPLLRVVFAGPGSAEIPARAK